MNLSHIITEFSFGPYIPDIVQPLDYSFETANERESRRTSISEHNLFSLYISSFHTIPILPDCSTNNLLRLSKPFSQDEPVQRDALHPCHTTWASGSGYLLPL
jgi:hypothetical protein